MTRVAAGIVVLATLGTATAPVEAWHAEGHRRIALAATEALPPCVPAVLRESAQLVAQAALEPDLHGGDRTPALSGWRAPEHYINLEPIAGLEFPADRWEFAALVVEQGYRPEEIGFLPYAVLELTERLAVAFAAMRQGGLDLPNPQLAVHAGRLAHFAADLCQPLHTTVHHDGKPGSEGLHHRVDALLDSVDFQGHSEEPLPVPDFRVAVFEQLRESHAQVARVLEMDLGDPRATQTFARERFRCATRFFGRLVVSAYRLSEELSWPPEHLGEKVHSAVTGGCYTCADPDSKTTNERP